MVLGPFLWSEISLYLSLEKTKRSDRIGRSFCVRSVVFSN